MTLNKWYKHCNHLPVVGHHNTVGAGLVEFTGLRSNGLLTKPHSTTAVILCFSLEGLKALEKRVILAGKDLILLSCRVHLHCKEMMNISLLYTPPSPLQFPFPDIWLKYCTCFIIVN